MKQLIFFMLFMCVFFINTTLSYAAQVIITGDVTGGAGGRITFQNVSSEQIVITTSIDAMGRYTTSLPPGTYNVTVVASQGSGTLSTTLSHQKITSNAIVNMTVPFVHGSGFPQIGFGFPALTIVFLAILSGCMYFFIKRRRNI